jgi:FAD binding domain of DNA photolyase
VVGAAAGPTTSSGTPSKVFTRPTLSAAPRRAAPTPRPLSGVDPDGTYVRRWVPELATVPERFVHRPWDDAAGPPEGYPRPIVDHAEEREEALRRLGAVTDLLRGAGTR